MNFIRMFFVLLAFMYSSHVSAENKNSSVLYFLNQEKEIFSIKGYDLEIGHSSFPLQLQHEYFVEEENQIDLNGGSYRLVVVITDVQTQQSEKFLTRVINDSNTLIVTDSQVVTYNIEYEPAIENWSSESWSIHAVFQLNFEDETSWTVNVAFRVYNQDLIDQIYFNPGDSLIVYETQSTEDFSEAQFNIKNPWSYTSQSDAISAKGVARASKSIHCDETDLYIIESKHEGNQHATLTFFTVDGTFELVGHKFYEGNLFHIAKQLRLLGSKDFFWASKIEKIYFFNNMENDHSYTFRRLNSEMSLVSPKEDNNSFKFYTIEEIKISSRTGRPEGFRMKGFPGLFRQVSGSSVFKKGEQLQYLGAYDWPNYLIRDSNVTLFVFTDGHSQIILDKVGW